MMLIVNGTMGSALPSNAMPFIAEQFGVKSPQQLVLPISIFMVGYLVGPIVWGPLSEQYGRRVIVLGTFICFAIWTMACAMAPNFAALIVFRLLAGVFGSAPIAIVPGIVADLYGNPQSRGRAMAVFMAVRLDTLAPISRFPCWTDNPLSDDLLGSPLRPCDIRLRVSLGRLALVLLDRPHIRRCHWGSADISARDVWPHPPRPACPKTPKGGPHR